MRQLIGHILALSILFQAFTSNAQEIPTLEKAPEITTGSFSNGLEYYLIPNAEAKGFADMALVGKNPTDHETARGHLTQLPHFQDKTPYSFLARHGIGYTENGYIVQTGDATVYSFRGVPVYSQEVTDSTLMLICDIASLSRSPQAVVVSGDIDVSKLRQRLELLSMMVPKLDATASSPEYQWRPKNTLDLLVSRNSTSDVAAVSAMFRAHRMPRDRMNTLQPLVSRTYAYMLDRIIFERTRDAFRKAGIPLGDTRFRYNSSASGPGDELYVFTVFTSFNDVHDATRIFASILSDIDANGVTADEFEAARARLEAEARREELGRALTNGEYVTKCISSYLYGASLASEAAVNKFVLSRRLDTQRELELFNGFAAALLDPARNLTLRFDVPNLDVDEGGLRSSFDAGWDSGASGSFAGSYPDAGLQDGRKKLPKVKISSETVEPVSGGKLWTFSNGTKVVYRKMETAGELHYSFMLRGGTAAVAGLRAGESAFVGDMLGLSDIAGMRGEEFASMLAGRGVTMSVVAGISDMRISGIAPKAELELLLRSLLTIAAERKPNAEDFEYYRKSEAVRIDMDALSPRNVNSLMDSIMRPDYYYTERKRIASLGSDLPERAEEFFGSSFSKVNDGLLVLIGDVDEEELKRVLCRTMGGFSVQKKFSQRPKVSSRFASGSVTYTAESLPGLVGGGELGVNVAMSASIPFSMSNYIALKAASACLRNDLVEALAEVGAYVEVSDRLEVFPAERMTVYINCRPCRRDGLPAGVEPAEPLKMLEAVRRVTSRMSSLSVSSAELAACREVLLSDFNASMANPEAVIEAVLIRYSDGKDLVSGFKDAVKALSASDIEKILSALGRGAGVEYVII